MNSYSNNSIIYPFYLSRDDSALLPSLTGGLLTMIGVINIKPRKLSMQHARVFCLILMNIEYWIHLYPGTLNIYMECPSRSHPQIKACHERFGQHFQIRKSLREMVWCKCRLRQDKLHNISAVFGSYSPFHKQRVTPSSSPKSVPQIRSHRI